MLIKREYSNTHAWHQHFVIDIGATFRRFLKPITHIMLTIPIRKQLKSADFKSDTFGIFRSLYRSTGVLQIHILHFDWSTTNVILYWFSVEFMCVLELLTKNHILRVFILLISILYHNIILLLTRPISLY